MSRAVSLGFPWGSNVPDFELGYYGFRVGLLAENSPKPWVRPIPPSQPAQRQPSASLGGHGADFPSRPGAKIPNAARTVS